MRRLAGGADDIEDLGLRQAEDRKRVGPGAPRAGVSVAALPGELACARRTLFRAHAHGVHQPSAEMGIGIQIGQRPTVGPSRGGVAIRRVSWYLSSMYRWTYNIKMQTRPGHLLNR